MFGWMYGWTYGWEAGEEEIAQVVAQSFGFHNGTKPDQVPTNRTINHTFDKLCAITRNHLINIAGCGCALLPIRLNCTDQ